LEDIGERFQRFINLRIARYLGCYPRLGFANAFGVKGKYSIAALRNQR
jgi:hypothetical protein